MSSMPSGRGAVGSEAGSPSSPRGPPLQAADDRAPVATARTSPAVRTRLRASISIFMRGYTHWLGLSIVLREAEVEGAFDEPRHRRTGEDRARITAGDHDRQLGRPRGLDGRGGRFLRQEMRDDVFRARAMRIRINDGQEAYTCMRELISSVNGIQFKTQARKQAEHVMAGQARPLLARSGHQGRPGAHAAPGLPEWGLPHAGRQRGGAVTRMVMMLTGYTYLWPGDAGE